MKPELLVVADSRPLVEEQLGRDFVLHFYHTAADREALLAEVAPRIRGIVTKGEVGASKALMDRLPALEIVACFGVGIDAIDQDACRARGVPITNTPDVLTEEVADMGLMLMLAVMRKLRPADLYVRSGRWAKEGPFELATSPRGKTMGILGLGRIGKAVARRAEVLGMQVRYHGRKRQEVAYPYEPDMVALARASDVLVLCSPGGAPTRHLVNAAVLDALGPEGFLVNVARGTVVDEAALVRALAEKKIAGAALDVFEFEPEVTPALLEFENVITSPHQASATVETRDAMGQLVVDNVRAHFSGRPLVTPWPL